MHIQFVTKDVELNSGFQDYVEQKVTEIIGKFANKPIELIATFTTHSNHWSCQISLRAARNVKIIVEGQGVDALTSFNKVAEKLQVQLKRNKQKNKSHKGKTSLRKGSSYVHQPHHEHDDIWDLDSVDASDIIKYEIARKKRAMAIGS